MALRVFDPRLLRFLTFLTRNQSWLSPPEMAKEFRLGGRRVGINTIYRWLELLEKRAGLAYFPHPRMNLLGLADVHVAVRGVRNPVVLSAVPWAYSFLVEVGLDGKPFVSQDYWIPGPATKAFEEYWKAATDLGLIQGADLLPVRNTHFIFSPFHEVIDEYGLVRIPGEVDNEYFGALIRRHLRERYEVHIGERIASSPLVVLLILEHLWRHCSSRHVWQAVQAKGEALIREYLRGRDVKALRKPGAVLQLLQQHWRDLIEDFDEVFLQPVVFWPPGLLMNCPVVSFTVASDSDERLVDLALQVSRRSVVTALMPRAGFEGGARIWCNPPSDRLPFVMRLAGQHQRGDRPPAVGIVDLEATRQATQASFCGFDWRSFSPTTLSWRFDGERYIEVLKGLKAEGSALR